MSRRRKFAIACFAVVLAAYGLVWASVVRDLVTGYARIVLEPDS
jgi:hypothetical protein